MRIGPTGVNSADPCAKLAEREGFEPSMEFYVPILP